jgi:hypothetical protein
MFTGIPITDRLAAEERTRGACAIDLTNGQLDALFRFEGPSRTASPRACCLAGGIRT